MSFLTENKLKNTVDLPIALPATTIKQGDWVVVSTVKVNAGQRLSLRALTLQLMESSVAVGSISSTNRVVSNLALAYVVLRQNYVSGTPGASGALDSLAISAIDVVSRSTVPLLITTAGYYSLIAANNMQASTSSAISTGTSIDFKLAVTGNLRLELIGQ